MNRTTFQRNHIASTSLLVMPLGALNLRLIARNTRYALPVSGNKTWGATQLSASNVAHRSCERFHRAIENIRKSLQNAKKSRNASDCRKCLTADWISYTKSQLFSPRLGEAFLTSVWPSVASGGFLSVWAALGFANLSS